MKRPLRKCFRRLGGDRRGATAIEYGLIASLIAVGAMASFSTLGSAVAARWTRMVADVPIAG